MSEESPLQVTPGSSMSLLKARSGLIARGLRDAATLAIPSLGETTETNEGICNKCCNRRRLTLEGCVCELCSNVLAEHWGHSSATDWVLLATPTDDINWNYPPPAVGWLNIVELLKRNQRSDPNYKPAERSTDPAAGWPPLGLLSCVSPEAELFRPVGDLAVTKYIFRDTTFEQVKVHWARANLDGGLEIGGPQPSDLAELLSIVAPWTEPTREDIPPLLRPATADEVALCEAILRDTQRREIVDRTFEKWGFNVKSVPVIAGITDPSKHQSCTEAWEELRKQFGELGLLEGSVFEQEADLKAVFEAEKSNTAPDEIIERIKSIRVIRPRQSLSWYRKAAGSGDAQAQFNLGIIYWYGNGVIQDYVEAVRFYREAAGQEYAAAQLNLGVAYYHGQGVEQDYSGAAEWFRKAGEQGIASGQFSLGYLYESGQGVHQDYAQALNWYRQAAAQGHSGGQNNLATMLRDGRGTTQDYPGAAKWFREAAEQGHVEAQVNLGWAYENGRGVIQDYGEAVRWYCKAAELGHAGAQDRLGFAYCAGLGTSQDYAEAAEWWRKAAEQGYSQAQYNLGWAYRNGRGVVQDNGEAGKWYCNAAQQGHADAQFELGRMYYEGEGVPQDHEEAVKWYRKAADQGHANAQHNLGVAFYYGKGVAQDFREAAEWVRRAAEQGNETAMFALGYMYQAGQGLLQDHAKAAGWFRQAAERGNASAQASLGAIYRDGQGVPQDYVQAHMWFNLSASVSSGDEQTRLSAEREAVAARMAPGRIAEAQALAREWKRRAPM